MRPLFFVLAALALFCSCSRERVVISGRIDGQQKGITVYLERVLPNSVAVADSASTDREGHFRFRAKTDGTPTIFNIRVGEKFITVLPSPGERVELTLPANLTGEYTVTGSAGSERMRELHSIMSKGKYRLDSLKYAFDKADQSERNTISAAYAKQYYASKQEQIQFILRDPGSIESVYALYQQLPSDRLMDNDKNTIYFQTVADSAGKRYPSSPYVKALNATIASRESKGDISAMINEKLTEESTNYPDVEMADIYGTKHKLSDLEGKVIILDFWSSVLPDNAIRNAELKELYTRYAEQGLEIYQVSIDEVKHSWVSAVVSQQLPWISVSDLRGESSPVLARYNIKSLPANVIISRDGTIAARNLSGEQLTNKIKELI